MGGGKGGGNGVGGVGGRKGEVNETMTIAQNRMHGSKKKTRSSPSSLTAKVH